MAGGGPRRGPRWGRMFTFVLVVVVLAVVSGWFYLDYSLNRVNALTDYAGRPAEGSGTNWLIIGSDSRDGLSAQQEQELSTGSDSGARSDTTMLFHIPSDSSKPTLVSLLRDSYVSIPGHGKNKLNAAYSYGGPALLVQTVEQATGLHIDHFVSIGFGGLVNVVDDVGGVTMCIQTAMVDPKAGLNLQPGCQTLNGTEALGYVRTRATPLADLERVVHQREFLAALLAKVTSSGTYLNPLHFFPLLVDAPKSVTVDTDTHFLDLLRMAYALRGATTGNVVTTTVPIGSTPTIAGVGSVVVWDANKANLLWVDLRTDQPVPANILSTTQ